MRENLTDQAYWAEESRQSTNSDAIQRILMFEMGKDFRKRVTPLKPRDYILPFRKGATSSSKKTPVKSPTTPPAAKKSKPKASKKK